MASRRNTRPKHMTTTYRSTINGLVVRVEHANGKIIAVKNLSGIIAEKPFGGITHAKPLGDIMMQKPLGEIPQEKYPGEIFMEQSFGRITREKYVGGEIFMEQPFGGITMVPLEGSGVAHLIAADSPSGTGGGSKHRSARSQIQKDSEQNGPVPTPRSQAGTEVDVAINRARDLAKEIRNLTF